MAGPAVSSLRTSSSTTAGPGRPRLRHGCRTPLPALAVATRRRPGAARTAGRRGDHGRPATGEDALNLALTAPGIVALGRPGRREGGFSEQFTDGMTTEYRSRLLGDTGTATRAAGTGAARHRAVHVLLLLYAATAETWRTRCAELVAEAGRRARLLRGLPTRRAGRTEAFGFHDGMSQPQMDGLARDPGGRRGQGRGVRARLPQRVRPADRRGRCSTPAADPAASPAPGRPAAGRRTWAATAPTSCCGQLRQDVDGVPCVHRGRHPRRGRPTGPGRAGAAGREDRRPLAERCTAGARPRRTTTRRSATATTSATTPTDPRGLACPLASHVRRANPRDSLEPQPGTEASLAINRRHRLLRRGRSYGSPTTDEERGVHFLCLDGRPGPAVRVRPAHLGEQPGVQRAARTRPTRWSGRARQARATSTPARPARPALRELPQFVHVRGGAYFFLPGVRPRCASWPAPPAAPPDGGRPVEQPRSRVPRQTVLARRSTRCPAASTAGSAGTAAEGARSLACPGRLRDTLRRLNLHDTEDVPSDQPAADPAAGPAAARRADRGRHLQRPGRPGDGHRPAPGSGATSRCASIERERGGQADDAQPARGEPALC